MQRNRFLGNIYSIGKSLAHKKKGTSDTVTWGSGLWGRSDVLFLYCNTFKK
nr:MAG TPA: hypothetical protein [Caudoviricetes sp.]